MHFTPNYAMSRLALRNLQATIPFFAPKEKLQPKKFLFMLRDPSTRTMSSWWVKEMIKKKNALTSQSNFGTMLQTGLDTERKLRECYASKGFNFSDMLTRDVDLQALRDCRVLVTCCLASLNSVGTERRAHVGKSLYAHTLVRRRTFLHAPLTTTNQAAVSSPLPAAHCDINAHALTSWCCF